MLYFGLTHLRAHLKRTMFMCIQIAFVMCVGILIISTYLAQTAPYRPFKDFISGKGFYGLRDYVMAFDEESLSKSKYVESISTVLEGTVEMRNAGGMVSLRVYGYDEMTSAYKPALSEGVWFTDAKNTEMIQAVITPNPFGVTTGDIVTMYDITGKEMKVQICGVLENGAQCYVPNINRPNSSIYDFYETFDFEINDILERCIFISKEKMQEAGIDAISGSRYLIKLGDDVSDETMEEYMRMFSEGDSFEELRNNTEVIVQRKLIVIAVVGIGALILVTLGNAYLVAIDTLASLKRYAVLYCCGMKWKNVIAISAVQTAGTGGLALLISITIGNIVRFLFGRNAFLFSLGGWQILFCVVFVAYMTVISAVIPYFILRKNQPVSVLRDSKL